MHVEPMRLEDLDEVLSIEKGSFPAPWSRNMFLEEMENRNSRLIVFKTEDGHSRLCLLLGRPG